MGLPNDFLFGDPEKISTAKDPTDYGPHEVRSKRDNLAQDSGASAADSSHEKYAHVGDREQDVEGYFCGARHIGGTTWRFGSGDLCVHPQYGSATLADHGQMHIGAHLARFIVAAIDNAIKESRVATREQTDGADPSESHDAQAAHKNTPIPAKQGEGLAAAVEQAWFEVSPMVRGQERIKAFGIFERLKAAALANLTEQDEAPPLDEWQPISDAPKDGNPILSWDGRYISITFWRRTGLRHQWVSELTGAGQEPTHWKPLPQPPIGNLPNGTQND